MRTGLLLVAPILWAASFLVHAENIQDRWVTPEKSRWSGFISFDYTQNKYSANAYLSERIYSGTAIIRYALNKDSRLQAVISGYHSDDGDDYGSQGDFWNDTSLSWSENNVWNPTDSVTMSTELRAIFPTSRLSQRQDLEFSVRGGVRFSFDLSEYVKGLYIGNNIRLRKNFHEYESAGGQPMTEYQLSDLITMDYFFAKRFNFSAYIIVRQSWNYDGGDFYPDLIHGEEFGYQLSDNIDLALGMTNGITYYNQARGTNPIHDLIDLDKMNFYFVANYQF
ncbi:MULTISPECIES: hypothetical protein [Ferrimonas]|uniref:hypothetical protein n=1 Tax=Ferrimonas TaxID=44011 RepID=UPI00048455DD|nr:MULTISPECIES: hypothetical protein [Ferrimonas]USD38412.1 hypothetical protein J8Z22_04525 [Ferrimonas sp. SCSIO 43195]